MKLWLSTTLTLLCLVHVQARGTELLINPGVDDPGLNEFDVATGWTLIEPDLDDVGGPVNSATFVTFANHNVGGTRALWYRSFEGGLGGDEPAMVNADLYQDVAGTPGDAYNLSAWYRYEAHYPGGDPLAVTDTVLALEFRDAGLGLLSLIEQNVDDLYAGTNDWFQVNIDGVAPAGTAFVRVRSSMINGVLVDTNPQSAYVDDFSLTPEPASGLLLALAALALRGRRGA